MADRVLSDGRTVSGISLFTLGSCWRLTKRRRHGAQGEIFFETVDLQKTQNFEKII